MELQTITEAINAHAVPRPYDWWIFTVGLGSVVIGAVAVFFSWRLNKKQSEIMEQQNNIAMFEKRYDVYTFLAQFRSNIHGIEVMHELDTLNDKAEYTDSMDKESITKFFSLFKWTNLYINCAEISQDEQSALMHKLFLEATERFDKLQFIFLLTDEDILHIEATKKLLSQITGKARCFRINFFEEINELNRLFESYDLLENLKKQIYFSDSSLISKKKHI